MNTSTIQALNKDFEFQKLHEHLSKMVNT